MLRYYDELGLLKPCKTDEFTGYRLYSASQIECLNKIIFLRDIGFNIAEISLALSDWDKNKFVYHIEKKKQDILKSIESEREKLSQIDMVLSNSGKMQKIIEYNVMIKSVPKHIVVSTRGVVNSYFDEGLLWDKLAHIIDTNKIKLTPNEINIAIYHDEDYKETNIDIEVCSVIGKNYTANIDCIHTLLPVKQMACIMVHGSFTNIAPAFLYLAEWLSSNNKYCMSNDPNRQICHKGPWNEQNEENFLTEIQIPVNNI